jgi:hypothetical protein
MVTEGDARAVTTMADREVGRNNFIFVNVGRVKL